MKILSFASLFLFIMNAISVAATYHVGPGKPYTSIGAVPWATLAAGDTVLIYWRSTAYKEKWVICRQGTAAAPITVRGVPNSAGVRPVIDGNGAITAPGLNFWNEQRGVIKIGGANVPADTTPKWITIENLDIRNAHTPYTFRGDTGATQAYSENAAAIYIEKGENITLRNNVIRDSGNGLFIASSDSQPSRNILVEANYIHNNGNSGSIYHHNVYTAAIGITYQYNRFGPLVAGATGNNLKDRSAGLLVRNNWIEGGNRQLDLVDAEDSVLIRTDPRYDETHVYGNVLIEPAGAGNRQIVHYGGDSGNLPGYRKGTLYFYNNTVVSTRTDRTTLFRLSSNDERCDARNNVFYSTAAGSTVSLLDASGRLDVAKNWIKPGWKVTFGTLTGVFNNGPFVEGTAPGFYNEALQDYRPAIGAQVVNAGSPLHPLVLPAHNVVSEYVKHQGGKARAHDSLFDIGAFELP